MPGRLRTTARRRRRPGCAACPAIDGLRAVAVAAVFLYHADAVVAAGRLLRRRRVLRDQRLPDHLAAARRVRTRSGTVALRRFWAGRARRLLPALFALLAVCLLIGATVERGKLVELRGDALASIFYVANWRFIFEHESYFAQFGRPPLLRHLWSLAVEEQFYLLWPPLFLLGMRLLRRAVLPALVALAAIGSTALMWALYTPGATPRGSSTAPTRGQHRCSSACCSRSSGSRRRCRRSDSARARAAARRGQPASRSPP